MRRGTKLLVAANSVSCLSWGLCWTYLNFRLYDIGASYAQLCLLDSLGAVAALTSRIWGALSDYYGRRKPFALLGLTASAFPMALMAAFNNNVWALLFSYLVAYLLWSVGYPAFIAALTSDPEREKASAAFFFVGSVGWALGASLMGPAERALGPAGVFLACLAISLPFPAIMAFYEEAPLPRKEGPVGAYVRGALSLRFRAGRGFGLLLGSVFLAWLGLQWASPLARMRLYDALGRSKELTGLIWAISSIISSLAVLAGARVVKRIGAVRVLAVSVLSYAVLMPCFAFLQDPGALIAAWLIPIWPFFNLGYTLSPAEFSREEHRGEAMGAEEVAKNAGIILGIAGGLVADRIGRESSLILSALPLSLAFLLTCACYGRTRGLRRTSS